MKRQELIHCVGGSTWGDYKKIYPEDEYLKELDKGVCVWWVYNDESERADVEMVDGWKNTLNVRSVLRKI